MRTLEKFTESNYEDSVSLIWNRILRLGKVNPKFKKMGTGPKYEDENDLENAGSINLVDAKILSELIISIGPQNVFELGTWFGTSAFIMCFANEIKPRVYTCDRKDLFVRSGIIEYPITRYVMESDKALKLTKKKKVKFDFTFIDGSLRNRDAIMLFRSMRRKIFAFHDFIDNEKGVRAYKEIRKLMSGKLIRPAKGSSIAVYYDPNDWNPEG